ncbi:SPT3 Dosage dependent suppressor of Ty-induced promoter mutations-like protein, partial [Mortierella sp. GBA43]
MIQGHQKSRQTDSTAAAAVAAAITPADASSPNHDASGQNLSHDIPTTLAGDPEGHFYLEVTVHLTSSESTVKACPECCHKVEGKVRKPSTGPGAPKVHGANDTVDPGQILQFCVSDHVVDFTHGTSTVMAKVLCSSTHHDKRGNNDRYFFKLSLMQYINGQKIRVGSCRTKDILFTGNHKNKSMASFSEEKVDVKPRIPRIDDDAPTSTSSSILMEQYSEEPDSIDQDPPSMVDSDEPMRRQHLEKDPYGPQPSRSPIAGASYMHAPSSSSDTRLGHHSAYPPTKSKSWNDSPITPKITKIIPDVGDMLGGAELTLFGSGFHERLVPYFDSLPATQVTFCHSDVMTCRIPPRLDPKVVNVSFHSSVSSGFSSARPVSDVQFSYADKTALLLAELAAEILAMGAYDDDEPTHPHRTGSFAGSDMGDRTEQRVGGLGDLRSKATKVIRRCSMRRDSSEVNSQRSGLPASRLNPMSDSPRPHSHSPLPLDPMAEDDEEFERVVAEMVTWSTKHSVAPSVHTSNALESAIVKTLRNAGDLPHISLPNNQGHTMLHLAVVLDMSQLVTYLLSERIEVNAEDRNGFT